MRFVKIRSDLFLIEQKVPQIKKTDNQPPTTSNVNHIIIYDRSYSMSRELKQLGQDVVEKIKELPVGDSITLGWFSGEGQYNFILKGYKISDTRDFKVLENTVNNNLSPVGCTCFSEVLTDTKQVIKDLSKLSDSFSFTFFTDGYPVVSDYEKEIKNIEKAIAEIEGNIASSLLVGYGNYYNKDLMAKMATNLGGSLTHCSSLAEYKISLSDFMVEASENGAKIKVALNADTQESDLVFGIKNQSITPYKISEDNTISFTPKKSGDSIIYILAKVPPKGEEVEFTQDALANRDPLVKGAYAASYLLTQKAKSDVALDILGVLGDKALIDAVNNSFTLEEFGTTEKKIKKAVTHPTYGRFTAGRDVDYLPKSNAFCVLDALDILLQDDNSFFYPYHKSFTYRRIGLPSKVKEGYPKFNPDIKSACPFNTLQWHSSKLNLSVRAKIKGTINLKEGYADHGFSETFPTYVYRNYTIIKDGFLNTGRIPVKLSESVTEKFAALDILKKQEDVTLLCLDKLPVINRDIANGLTSATALCRSAYEEVKIQAELKVLKYVRNEIEPIEKSIQNDFFSEEQIKFLAENGIGKQGFQPEVELAEAQDFYYANEFAIKIKGLSSLPKIDDVRKKIEAGKKLTVSASLIEEGLNLFHYNPKRSKKVQLVELDEAIVKRKVKLNTLRQKMQRTKFAILLASKWFDEFDSREDCSLELDGNYFTFGVRSVKIKI